MCTLSTTNTKGFLQHIFILYSANSCVNPFLTIIFFGYYFANRVYQHCHSQEYFIVHCKHSCKQAALSGTAAVSCAADSVVTFVFCNALAVHCEL